MATPQPSSSRRDFLRSSFAIPLALGAGAPLHLAQAPAPPPAADAPAGPLPTRPLGRTGAQTTLINMGGMTAALSPQYIDIAWSMGIRTFDTADCYLGGKSETKFAEWFKLHPERRKEIFLVTKDHPKQGPAQLLTQIDKRLAACGTDFIDLFFIHMMDPKEYGEASLEWPKSKELKDVVAELKASGKVRHFGFTAHTNNRARYMKAAAEGGFIDAIMFSYNPFLQAGDELNQAIDACHKAEIGLIAMKTMRGLRKMPARLPEFDPLNLTTAQAMLHACFSDERLACVCVGIENAQQMGENTAAARSYKSPMPPEQIQHLKQTAMAVGPEFCPNCDGRCARACGSDPVLNEIARYVSYYEQNGDMTGRELYRALPASVRESARAADLAAASDACLCRLDFANILAKAERYFA